MSGLEQTLWMEDRFPAGATSLRNRKMVFGVGINDATYCVQPVIDGKQANCPAYRAWKHVLERACSSKWHARKPTYIGVVVCDEWHSFSSFRLWWIENQVDGWHIDKDMLSDDGAYSPEACIFVPQWLNKFTIDSCASRGEFPVGVCLDKRCGRFRSQCCNPITKKQESLGYFGTPEEANLAWMARKLELALELKPSMDEIDLRIYPRVVDIINNAK